MKDEFKQLEKFYRDNEFEKIFTHKFGLYFLKLRSISRSSLLTEFGIKLSIKTNNIHGNKLFEHIFCCNIADAMIDNFIRETYKKERSDRIKNEDYLYSQLYKMKFFDWGGFYQNNVEKTIVDNYIKKIQNYDQLCNSIDNDLAPRLKCYTLCSWYNHWTSILIEDMVKDNPAILPTVGLVKKIDFFWKNFPFDLKVTYFPEGYMKIKRREMGLRPELTELKQFAGLHQIHFNRESGDNEIFDELFTKILEDTSEDSKQFMITFQKNREQIILQTFQNPRELVKWFYEEQGTRRFDAANRFFIVLIDLNKLEDSWKLKRNKTLLLNEINKFFNQNKEIELEKLKITFNFENEEYSAYGSILFIVKK